MIWWKRLGCIDVYCLLFIVIVIVITVITSVEI